MLDNVKSFKDYLNSLLPDGFNGYIEIFHQNLDIANGVTLLRNLISEFGFSRSLTIFPRLLTKK